jgi:CRP/FNR family cyclic AMP-dependent transcriptional regulator
MRPRAKDSSRTDSDTVGAVTRVGRPTANVCYVLREDPELAETVAPDRREQAMDAFVAREVSIRAGAWRGPAIPIDGGIGLLVLEGVMIRRVGIDRRYGAELIGEGDVLRSMRDEREVSSLKPTVDWLTLAPTRVAVLDERFVRQLALFPQIAGRLFARSVLRSHQLSVNMAIIHQARVDDRLHLLFWHLATRWGRVRSDGVLVPLRLTHTILADLVAARRPTVTSALTELGKRGLIRSVSEGWLLSGSSPENSPDADAPGTRPGEPSGEAVIGS